jgi:hypothetical protein
MAVSHGLHAKTLLLQLKQSDWLPEYNTTTVRDALNETSELSKEIMATLKDNNYKIVDAALGHRKFVGGNRAACGLRLSVGTVPPSQRTTPPQQYCSCSSLCSCA